MLKQINYKGYEVIGIENKSIVAIISNNLHLSQLKDSLGFDLMHEPPIKFKFSSYENMVSFIDQNPR